LPTSGTSASPSSSRWDPPEGDEDLGAERRNVTRLIRWIAAFVAWPSLSIALAFLVFTGPQDHWLHIAGLMPLGIAALVLFVQAPKLAKRFVKEG
jgi:membrane protein YdbS with pleckstrin-like domain